MADDQYNEFLNNCLVKTLSPNRVTAEILESKSKSLFFAHQIRVMYLREVQELYAKRSNKVQRDQDFNEILEKMEQLDLFQFVNGRDAFKGFESLPENIYLQKNTKEIRQWMSEHIKKFSRSKHLHTNHKLNVADELIQIEEDIDGNDVFSICLRSRTLRRQ